MNDDLDRDDRPELHIPSIDEDRARQGECARVHLPSGDVCTLQRHHAGSCQFVIIDDVPLSQPTAPLVLASTLSRVRDDASRAALSSSASEEGAPVSDDLRA